MLQRFALASSKISKILACVCQTQRTIRAATNLVGIVAVLAVIFPKANWANLITSSLAKCPATATRATIKTAILGSLLGDVRKCHTLDVA